MKEHERLAFEASLPTGLHHLSDKYIRALAIWQAARAYELPAVCGAKQEDYNYSCDLPAHSTGDHKHDFEGYYVGWSNEQENDHDDECSCGHPKVYHDEKGCHNVNQVNKNHSFHCGCLRFS